ncbi:hypothetical protein [Luteimonas saliphila]|uniref:hypothetical protein n=1 Tax=Luteimonas saliphila TaxID=2804919 RepID=UPI00192D3528|nr:hypothetical protein [Luteimonas saliphila]
MSLAVPRPLQDRIVDQLQHAGMQREDGAGRIRLSGDDWYLVLESHDSNASGLEYIELRAGGTMDAGCGFALGNSTVNIEHSVRMRWRFGAQPTQALPPCGQQGRRHPPRTVVSGPSPAMPEPARPASREQLVRQALVPPPAIENSPELIDHTHADNGGAGAKHLDLRATSRYEASVSLSVAPMMDWIVIPKNHTYNNQLG